MNKTTSDPQFRVLISRAQIMTRVAELAALINADFRSQELLLLGVLQGAKVFLNDLAKQLSIPIQIDYLAVSSYGAGTTSNRSPRLVQDTSHSFAGRNVLIVEDILDSGYTLNFLFNFLRQRQPRNLKVATLLDKPASRILPFTADYVGFAIADEFVVGYGLDFNEQYRELPEICVLSRTNSASSKR